MRASAKGQVIVCSIAMGVILVIAWVFWSGGSIAEDGSAEAKLIVAAMVGDLRGLEEQLAAGANIDALDGHGHYTALGAAAMQGRVDAVRLLLQRGANVHRGNPLYYAAGSRNAEVVGLLLAAGANPNEDVVDGVSRAVLGAGREGDVAVVLLLLKSGASFEGAGRERFWREFGVFIRSNAERQARVARLRQALGGVVPLPSRQ